MESQHGQRRHRHYRQASLCFGVANFHNNSRGEVQPSAHNFPARNSSPGPPTNKVRRSTAAAALEKQLLNIPYWVLKRTSVVACFFFFFPRVPCWPRDRQRRRTSCSCVTSPMKKKKKQNTKKNCRKSNLYWSKSSYLPNLRWNISCLCSTWVLKVQVKVRICYGVLVCVLINRHSLKCNLQVATSIRWCFKHFNQNSGT